MGILRSDRVSGLGGANAINGSVFFGGTTSDLRIDKNDEFQFASGSDFTIEAWVKGDNFPSIATIAAVWDQTGAVSGDQWLFCVNNSGTLQFAWSPERTDDLWLTGGTLSTNTWHHVAISRTGDTFKLFLDGTQVATDTQSGTNASNSTLQIGKYAAVVTSQWNGNISNLRIIKGEGIYTAAFTPPTTRLEKTSNTVLLCCQSPGDITQEATGKLITPTNGGNSGNPKASRLAPDKGEDHGTTFEDNTRFDTLSYMVPPGGTTAQSNRGRGVFGGGYTSVPSGAAVKRIYYVQIDSMGTSAEFGDMDKAAAWGQGGCSSSTRGLFTGGTNPTNLQDIDYITIATTSNGLDFGNLNVQHGYTSSCSNETRGLTGGGRGGSPVATIQEIDYVTIATTGNGADFGDLSAGRMALGAFESSTRGYFSGGDNSPTSPATVYKNIDTVLFATLGSTSDFGDMTDEHDYHGTCSSSTRGIMYGGNTSYGPTVVTNIIEYVTTSSTGSGTDFGDVRDDGAHAHGTSNSIRGVFAGGTNPYRNSIDFITIATTGNGQDWGDLPDPNGSYAYAAALSDSHGGLS